MTTNLPSHELVSSDPLSALKVAESVCKSAIKINDFATASTALTIKSICQTETTSFKSALECAKLSLDYAKRNKDKRRIGYSENIYGKSLTRSGFHIKALKHLHSSKSIAKEINDSTLTNGSSRNLLITYSELGDFDTALLLLLELNMTASKDDPMYKSYQESNLASLYNLIGDHRSALLHAKDAFDSSKNLQLPLDYCRMLSGLARSYIETGQYEKSRGHSLEELEIASQRHFLFRKACALYNLGYSYFKEGNMKTAKKHIGESLKIHSSMHSWEGIIDCHTILSGICFRQNDLHSAAKHIQVVVEMGEAAKAFGVIGSYYKGAAQVMDQLNKGKLALRYYQQFCQYDDNLSQFKNNALLLQLSDRFEAGSKTNDGINQIEPLSFIGYNQMQILKRIKQDMKSTSVPNEKDKFILQLATSLLDMQGKGALVQTSLSDEQRLFSTQLLKRFPKITRTELIVCQLLRNGSSSKDIARILAISPETVSKHRASIRSKLRVPSNATLQSFFLGFSQ